MLVNCAECNKEISDTVSTCPHCGYVRSDPGLGSEKSATRQCPDCNKAVSAGNNSCPSCGCPMEEESIPLSEGMMPCPSCTVPISETAMNCPHCGFTPPNQSGTSSLLIGLIIVAVAVIFVAPPLLEKPCDDNLFRNCSCGIPDMIKGYCVVEVERPTNAEMCGKIVDLLENAGEIEPGLRNELQNGCVNRTYEMNEMEYFKLKAMGGKLTYQ